MAAPSEQIFICYSHDDVEFAEGLALDLKKAGLGVWWDQPGLKGGQEWDRKVEEAVRTCRRMLVILSSSSVESNNVRNEYAFALDNGKTVIPVLLRDCSIPLNLYRHHRVDFRFDRARGLEDLLKALDVVRSPEPTPDIAPSDNVPPAKEGAAEKSFGATSTGVSVSAVPAGPIPEPKVSKMKGSASDTSKPKARTEPEAQAPLERKRRKKRKKRTKEEAIDTPKPEGDESLTDLESLEDYEMEDELEELPGGFEIRTTEEAGEDVPSQDSPGLSWALWTWTWKIVKFLLVGGILWVVFFWRPWQH